MRIKKIPIDSVVFKENYAFKTHESKSIKGKVMENGLSLPCRVRLFERKSGMLMAEVLTDPDGNYVFTNLREGESFFVVAHHPKLQFNAVIQDNVEPK